MPAKAAKGYYTPHSDYALGVKQSKAGEAVALAEQLAAKMQSRGTDFSFVAEINLRGLAEDLAAPDDGDGMPPPPKIKSTVLAYTVIARAAITAELEITKGGYEKVVGWLEPGTEIQAQQIGETTTGRQRVLDSKAWWVKGVPGEGWVSVHSVKGKKLLVPVLTQWMPKDKIRVEPDQWEGSATRQGVSFEYDPTFLPPAERRGKRNKLTKPVRELVQTPVANTWQMDRLNAAAAATVKHMFSNVGLRPERVRLDGEAEVLAWRPAPDVPHVVSQHKANPGRVYSRANQSDYYREPAGTWLDPDYLSFVQRRYPNQDLKANLAAERTAERYEGKSGVEKLPWEGPPSALIPGSRRRPKDPKYGGDAADRLDKRSISSKVLHGLEGPASADQLDGFLAVRKESARELYLRENPPGPPQLQPPPPTPVPIATEHGSVLVLPSQLVALGAAAAVEDTVGGAWALAPAVGMGRAAADLLERGGPRLYGGDMKRYSKVYERALRATDRKTIRHSGALAAQRSAMFRGGGYFESRNKVVEATESLAGASRPCRADWDENDAALAQAAAPKAWNPGQPALQDGGGGGVIGSLLDRPGAGTGNPREGASPGALSDITERMSECSSWTESRPGTPAFPSESPAGSRARTPDVLNWQLSMLPADILALSGGGDEGGWASRGASSEGGGSDTSRESPLQHCDVGPGGARPGSPTRWELPPSIPELGAAVPELGTALSWRQQRGGAAPGTELAVPGAEIDEAYWSRRGSCTSGSSAAYSDIFALVDAHQGSHTEIDAEFRATMVEATVKAMTMSGPALRRHERWMKKMREDHAAGVASAEKEFQETARLGTGWVVGSRFKVLRNVSVKKEFEDCESGKRFIPLLEIADAARVEVDLAKQVLRAAATVSRDKNWTNMLQKFNKNGSGLLSIREFFRCIRRYVGPAEMTDGQLDRLCRAVDSDGSGEISIAEFEQFLNTGKDMAREITAATKIQACRRGRMARDKLQYDRSVLVLQRKADSQADLIKRRLRSLGYEGGGTDWKRLFDEFDKDGSGLLQFDEFRRACRKLVNQYKVTDRELGILFKRMDTDQSGEIDLNEFESFLISGPSADHELGSALRIQSRTRGRNARRAAALAGLEQRWVNVGAPRRVGQDTSLWKWERLTEPFGKTSMVWPSLCHVLHKRTLQDGGKVGTAAVVCSTAERADWLADRLIERQNMLVDRVHANMEPVERAKVMAKWLDRDHRRQLDERGRRPVLVLTDLCSSEWAELRLGDLNLQRQVSDDTLMPPQA